MESKQLKAYKQHSEKLAQFIIRLTTFYEGLQPDIDRELQTLRGYLAGTPNFTLAQASVNKLNSLLQNTDTTVKKHTKESLAQLEVAIKGLQRQLENAPALKKEATTQLIAISQPLTSMFDLYRLLCNGLSLYQKSVETLSIQPPVEPSPGNDVSQVNKSQALYRSIFEELSQLIAHYADKKPNDPQLTELRQRLNEGMSEDDLLQSCVVIIRMIVQDAMSEATFTGKVINNLHQSLGGLQSGLSDTISQANQLYDSRATTNNSLRKQLDSMEDAVAQSETLDALKEQAQAYMKDLSDTLEHQEEADKTDKQALLSLLSSMQSQLTQLQKQTQSYRKKLAEQVVSSQTDPLTRLPNRQAYNEKMSQAFKAAQKGQPLTVAVADIDHFKSINDRFGHVTGDKTLQLVARHLRHHLDTQHFVARWGGEEFVLILQNVSQADAFNVLDVLREKLASVPFKFKQEKLSITASFGVASFQPGDTPESLFHRADRLLYKAKDEGRNRVVTDKDNK